MTSSTEPLYHYTTAATLLKILESGEIWLSDLRYMNDALELQYFFSEMEKSVRSRPTVPPNLPSMRDDGAFRVDRDEEYDRRFCEEAHRLLSHLPFCGAFCLSRAEDSLVMWRAYARTSLGVSIEFDRATLEKLMLKKNAKLLECNYDPLALTAEIDRWKERMPDFVYWEYHDVAAKEYFDQLLRCASTHKHWSFQEERECRIVKSLPLDSPFSESPPYNPSSELKFRPGPLSLIPYLPISIREPAENLSTDKVWNWNWAIRSIRVGPTKDSGLAKESILAAARCNGLPLQRDQVLCSSSPFRDV